MLNWVGNDQPMKMRETSRAIDKKLWVNNYLGKQKNITKREWYIASAVAGNDSTETNWDYYSDSFSPW